MVEVSAVHRSTSRTDRGSLRVAQFKPPSGQLTSTVFLQQAVWVAVANTDPLPQEALPGLFQAADKASLKAQSRFIYASGSRFILVVAAAALAVASLETDTGIDLAAIGVAVLFVAAVLVEIWLLQDRPLDTWYDGRALAESSKTLAWRYAVGGRPFAKDSTNSEQHLIADLRGLIVDSSDSAIEASGSPPVSSEMRELREASLAKRKAAYLAWRLDDQRAWYRRKAQWNAKRVTWWRIALISLELIGVLAALARAFGAINFDLPGLVAAVIAVGAAWLSIKQHESLARAYKLASEEIALAREQLAQVEDEASWASGVADAEEGISREHTMWRASRCAPSLTRRLESRETRWRP